MSSSDSFRFKDFYCRFNGLKGEINAEDRPYKKQLDVFIEKENMLIKVNTLILPRNLSLEKVKDKIDDYMCCEIGKIREDGTVEKCQTNQGYVYKNYENFYKRYGKCYIAECEEGKITEAGVSFNDICEEVITYLMDCNVDINKVPRETIESLAKDVFTTVDWQLTSSLIFGDDYLEGYVEEFPKEYFINEETEQENESNDCF